MSPLRTFHGLVLLLAVLGTAALSALGFLAESWRASERATAQLRVRRIERDRLREVAPDPGSRTVEAVEARIRKASQELAALESELGGNGPAAVRLRQAGPPVLRSDAYFELATFVERMNTSARSRGIVVESGAERFGFAAHVHEGPEEEWIPIVIRQAQVAESLLEALFECRPRALLSVRREAPASLLKRAEPAHTEALRLEETGEGADYFVPVPGARVRIPEFVESLGFRIGFTGQTETLRRFLNRLTALDPPIVVREVQAEPEGGGDAPGGFQSTNMTWETEATMAPASFVLTGDGSSPALQGMHRGGDSGGPEPWVQGRAFRGESVPIVGTAWSKFTVTLECITSIAPVDPDGAGFAKDDVSPGGVDAVEGSAVAWEPPEPQPRGPEWIYDVFTPPEIHFHIPSRQFAVRPPRSLLAVDAGEEFGVVLVSIRPEPFRLQLMGYASGRGGWVGTFESAASGEVFLAGAGDRIPKLGITISRVDVLDRPVEMAESMTTMQRIGTAVVRDELTGREVVLSSRERGTDAAAVVVVKALGDDDARELRAGEKLTAGDATYRIDRVQLAPPAVEITRVLPDSTRTWRRTLFPVARGTSDAGGGFGAESQRARGGLARQTAGWEDAR